MTNVGVAQPRRRTNQQCQNIATDGRQRIEDHQGTTKPLKVRNAPFFTLLLSWGIIIVIEIICF